ncbi:MAG: hypothetical protein IH820_11920 [Bacteroidetes bacterium]|nr:hypothetical protein [Bacteroidota bacterium]
MATFEVATGIHEETCNALFKAFYERNYPRDDSIFRISRVINNLKLGLAVDVKEPPVLDFTTLPEDAQELQDVAGAAAASVAVDYQAFFRLVLPVVDITVDLLDGGDQVKLQFTVSYKGALRTGAAGQLDIDQRVFLAPLAALASDPASPPAGSGQPDPAGVLKIVLYLLNQTLLPQLATKIKPILQKLPIPKLEFEGIQFDDFQLSTQQHHLVATGLVGAADPEAVTMDTIPTPEGGFFALVTQSALQNIVDIQVARNNVLRGNARSKVKVGFVKIPYKLSYEVKITEPEISLSGTELQVNLEVDARAKGSVKVFEWIGLPPLKASIVPEASVKASLVIDEKNQVSVVAAIDEPFTIVFKPTGNVPQVITGAVLAAVLNVLAAPLGAAVTAFVKKSFNFKVFTIPDRTVTIQKTPITFKPSDIEVINVQGMLCARGRFVFE